MTIRTHNRPAPPCTGQFDSTCVECGHLMHPKNAVHRTCDKGHQPYGARGRCGRCYGRAYRGLRLPRVSLRRHGNRKPRRRPTLTTRTLVNLRKAPRRPTGTILAPCSGCWRIRPLPYGPGDAYCEDCDPPPATTETDADTPA